MTDIKIAVLGGGAWGTALAANSARAGHNVIQWMRDDEQAKTTTASRINEKYLPGKTLPEDLNFTSDITLALKGADIVLMCIPAQKIADISEAISPLVRVGTAVISCAKGIDRNSGQLPSQLISDAMPGINVGVLSGPSFAHDLVAGLPTAVSVASHEIDMAEQYCKILSTRNLRCYANDDIKGVELGGALKNVIALSLGVARGQELGASAEAALIARGFAELQRLALSLGANQKTLAGLSGLGDLVLTCSSTQSRNFAYGVALGQNVSRDTLPLAEGVYTAKVALELAVSALVDTPIIKAVTSVLENEISPEQAVRALLERPLKRELED